MAIEAEFYSYRDNRREMFHGKTSIQPGGTKVITHLKSTKVLAILNIDNTRGEIRIKKPKRAIAFKYEDEDDSGGTLVDPSKPIEIKSGQNVQLIKKTRTRRKTLREIYFWFKPNDDSYEEAPNPEGKTTVPV